MPRLNPLSGLFKPKYKTKTAKRVATGKKRKKNLFWAAYGPVFKKAAYGCLGLCFALWVGLLIWASDVIETAKQNTHQFWLAQTKEMGFKVNDIPLVGRVNTDRDVLLSALDIQKDDPIFAFDMAAAHATLAENPWIKSVKIQRKLPDKIIVELEERTPVALWQHQGEVAIIDIEGQVLTRQNLGKFQELPIITGKNARDHVRDITAIMAQEPDISQRLDAAIRIGQRRWNLKLQNGMEIRLPEQDTELAIAQLIKEHENFQVLDQNFTSIDLRNSDKIVYKAKSGIASDILNAGVSKP